MVGGCPIITHCTYLPHLPIRRPLPPFSAGVEDFLWAMGTGRVCLRELGRRGTEWLLLSMAGRAPAQRYQPFASR